MFVEQVELLLNERKIQKKDFLSALGLNINSFSAWRQRGTVPSGDVLKEIADYLDCSVDFLLGRTDKPEVNK